MIAVSTLLKSCAMPPASWPIACIFWLWAKFSCSVRCSVVSSAKTIALAPSSPCGSAAETKKRAERAPSPSSATSTGAMSPLPSPAAAIASRSAGVIALGDAAIDRGTAFARARPSAPAGASRAKAPLARRTTPLHVDRGNRHRRRIEESREAHFGGAQIFALVFARRAVEHQRARGAGQARRWRRRRDAAGAPAGTGPAGA